MLKKLIFKFQKKGMCFIETKNLDGETNLKHKFVHKDLMGFYGNDSDVYKYTLREIH